MIQVPGRIGLELRVVAMRRTGHHAITNWIAHHFRRNEVVWMNDIPESEFDANSVFTKRTVNNYGMIRKRGNKTSRVKPYMDNRVTNVVSARKNCLIHSYEDKWLSDVQNFFGRQDNGPQSELLPLLFFGVS